MTRRHYRRPRCVSCPQSLLFLSECSRRHVLMFFSRLYREDPTMTNINNLNISRYMILLLSLTLFCVHAYDGCCQTTLQRRCRTSTSKKLKPFPVLAYLPLRLYLLFRLPRLFLPRLLSLFQISSPSEKLPALRRWTLPSKYVNMSCQGVAFVGMRDVRMSI